MTQPAKSEYDAIAGAYKDSKQQSFRKYIEEYTLFEMLRDISGVKALDLACGEEFYTRKLKQAGAGEVLGVEVSAEMIRLAEAEERARPTGCRYLNRDAAALVLDDPVDLVLAMYLLNYARNADELLRFVQAAHGALKPGGRFVGFNDNVLNVHGGTVSYARYGFKKYTPGGPKRWPKARRQRERGPGRHRPEQHRPREHRTGRRPPRARRLKATPLSIGSRTTTARGSSSTTTISHQIPITGFSRKPASPVFTGLTRSCIRPSGTTSTGTISWPRHPLSGSRRSGRDCYAAQETAA